MSKTVRISEEMKELVDDVADQLDITVTEVMDGILVWFFSSASALMDAIEEEEAE